MAIDINEPVEQGQDMILNYDDGSQKLGSANSYDHEAKAGKLLGLPPNDNPNGDVNPVDSYETVDKSPVRDGKGHFVKK